MNVAMRGENKVDISLLLGDFVLHDSRDQALEVGKREWNECRLNKIG